MILFLSMSELREEGGREGGREGARERERDTKRERERSFSVPHRSAWCSETKRLVLETKACVSATRQLCAETVVRQLQAWVSETVVQKLKRGFRKLDRWVSATRNARHYPRHHPPPHPPPISIATPTRTVAETDKTSC